MRNNAIGEFSLARTIFVTILTASMALSVSATNVTWEPLGPPGGDQFDVVISPDDPNTIYTLAHFAIHSSTDAGQTWRSLQNADMASSTFLSMTIKPLNTLHLYAANTTSGVWESLNQGDTWTNCSSGLPLIEGLTDISNLPEGGGGYTTLDGGTTWDARSLNAFRIAVDPSETITLAMSHQVLFYFVPQVVRH